jgi:hypothetical protein
LTDAEVAHAAIGGVLRQVENLRANLRDAYGLTTAGWGEHIVGALAECAVAKYLRTYWSTGERGESDVGAYQVRYASRADYSLIVHPSDDDTAPYVLVVGGPYTFTLIGWTWGAEGKQSKYWAEPVKGRAAFFVPQSELYPLSEMPIL